MKNIFKDLKSLEIIRNIIRETLMGNATLVLLIAVAVHFAEKQNKDIPDVFFAVFLVISAAFIFGWLFAICAHYFRQLVATQTWVGTTLFISWLFLTELIVLTKIFEVLGKPFWL